MRIRRDSRLSDSSGTKNVLGGVAGGGILAGRKCQQVGSSKHIDCLHHFAPAGLALLPSLLLGKEEMPVVTQWRPFPVNHTVMLMDSEGICVYLINPKHTGFGSGHQGRMKVQSGEEQGSSRFQQSSGF